MAGDEPWKKERQAEDKQSFFAEKGQKTFAYSATWTRWL
jgi:hypothetical protein